MDHRAVADPRGTYRTFVREQLAPGFRELGLRGSGVRYELPDERFWATVGLQADWRQSRSGIVRFTVNLAVADKAAWKEVRTRKLYYPERPPANSAYGMEAVEAIRIGQLIPISRNDWDRWWTLDEDHPPAAVAADVIAAIRHHGLPWLGSRMAGSGDGDLRERT